MNEIASGSKNPFVRQPEISFSFFNVVQLFSGSEEKGFLSRHRRLSDSNTQSKDEFKLSESAAYIRLDDGIYEVRWGMLSCCVTSIYLQFFKELFLESVLS